jgi:ubiquinone/menaquinone biosynthesis C-methylase UbiE
LAHTHGGVRPYNDPERRKWQDPEAILRGIGLKPGLTFADIGCGGGFFAIPAARMVGPKGKVYGLDVDTASIAALQKAAAAEDLTNLYVTAARAEDAIVCQHCADIVFFGIALHDFQDASLVLKNARQIIKPRGKLIDLDWNKKATFGPPTHVRFSEAKASRLIEAAGFKVETVAGSGPNHYLITAKPV